MHSRRRAGSATARRHPHSLQGVAQEGQRAHRNSRMESSRAHPIALARVSARLRLPPVSGRNLAGFVSAVAARGVWCVRVQMGRRETVIFIRRCSYHTPTSPGEPPCIRPLLRRPAGRFLPPPPHALIPPRASYGLQRGSSGERARPQRRCSAPFGHIDLVLIGLCRRALRIF
jgi:hypothetical protein